MQSQMVYAGERSSAAREMAMEMMAADQRQMGSCSPLGRFISRVFKCTGSKGRMRSERVDYYGARAYPTAQTCYVSPAAPARAVAFATTNAHPMRPQPMQAHAVAMPMAGATYGAASPRAAGGGGGGKRKKKKSKNKRVRFAPAGAEPVPTDAPPPHTAHYAPPAAAAAAESGGGQLHHQHYPSAAAGAEPYSTASSAAHGQGHGRYAYAPLPLARWEMLGSAAAAGTLRRHEYFSGEYRWYYPTPVREGIYSLATDANRLTTIFSEENPNACAII